jgi:asparagine synthase (glutamine-hydrolysing)
MSGILGIWNFDGQPVETSELTRLSATLSHRGPDGEGTWIQGAVGLGSQLFRVTPESLTETQPLVDSSGVALVFDGRLDNREELLAVFGPASEISPECPDAALALAAYRAYGDIFPERLNGDFALGLFDPNRRKMLVARDAIGLRPLYYYATRGVFLFASEVKTLLAHPHIVSRPAHGVLADFLLNRLAAEDGFDRTFFHDIFSLPPAHLAIVTAETVVTRQYWDFDATRQVRFNSFPEYSEAFRHYFDQAVRRRLRSAAPVAVSVSGGLDSSSIFCLGETIRRSNPIRYPSLLGLSYTAPDGSPSDEKAFLLHIEQEYGVEIERFGNLPSGLMDGCRQAIWHIEAPLLDGQWSGTHAFMTAVRRSGARVLLTGHWGDQILANTAYLVDLCRRGCWREAWRQAHEYGRWQSVSDRGVFRRRLLMQLIKSRLPPALIPTLRELRAGLRSRREWRPWYTPGFRRQANANGCGPHAMRRFSNAHAQSLYRQIRSRYHVLCMEWNNKVAVMHGVEMAFPFLDRDLVAFLMAIPGEVQSRNGIPKGIMREALRGVLPEAIARRTSKADFTSVVNDAIAQDYDLVLQCLRPGSLAARFGYVNEDTMTEELARARSELRRDTCESSWAIGDLLALELWLEAFFDPTGQGSAPVPLDPSTRNQPQPSQPG